MRGDAFAPGTRPFGNEGAGGRAPSSQTWLLVSIAALAVLLGALVYVADRDPGHVRLMPGLGGWADGSWFGALGQWLPSFVHPLAFGLFTAACLPSPAGPRYAACAAWGALNIAFEIGQHPLLSQPWADALRSGEARGPLIDALARYFVGGTFDAGDIVAALLGSLAAAAVLRLSCKEEECEHAT